MHGKARVNGKQDESQTLIKGTRNGEFNTLVCAPCGDMSVLKLIMLQCHVSRFTECLLLPLETCGSGQLRRIRWILAALQVWELYHKVECGGTGIVKGSACEHRRGKTWFIIISQCKVSWSPNRVTNNYAASKKNLKGDYINAKGLIRTAEQRDCG